jgi:hypothetical protein
MSNPQDALKQQLFGGGGTVFAVLDGASVPELLDKLYGSLRPEFECLYRGDLEPDLAEIAPYLVRLDAGSEFTDWVLAEGWGKHWGVFAVTSADLRAMRMHLRRFVMVHDAEGKPLYFRYYDPRVLRTYLPTCNSKELEEFFGPVAKYVGESEQPGALLEFRSEAGALVVDRKELA